MSAVVENLEFNDGEYNDDRLECIKTDIGEGLKTQSLIELKSLLTQNLGLRACLDENFLLRFLRGARYRPNTALKRLQTYYFTRNLHPEIFENYLPSHTLPAQALNHINALPYRAKNLSAVVVIKLGRIDFQKVPFMDLLRLELMVFETLMQNPVTQICGITVIIDCDSFSQTDLSEIVNCLPACYDLFHNDCTLGIKYLHVIKAPALLYLLYQNILSAWSQEQQTQVMFYLVNSDLKELRNQVSLDYLPEEYGGKLLFSNLVDLNPLVNDKENYFQEKLQYGILNNELELD